ncbi:MAG: hypothetical protein FWD94_06415 [Treponema sp.]|nr:hypothetical protein [Treponema sp.]
MKKRVWLLIALGALLVVLAVPVLVFLSRSPVLVVTDVPFAVLYGENRIRMRQVSASVSLFRMVRPVMIADDASPDIVIAAIKYASENPFAVLFPRRFSAVAERFHAEYPEIPVVVFRGTVPASELPAGNGVFNVYGTDRGTDLFRAGLFAGIIGSMRQEDEDSALGTVYGQRIHVLWQGGPVDSDERSVFSLAAMERDPGSAVVFVNAAADLPDTRLVSSLVLAGAGADYLERNPGIPVILFSWLNPDFTSREVVVMFDDSPWAMVVPATRMAVEGVACGVIPSIPLVFSDRLADNATSRMLRRAAGRNL